MINVEDILNSYILEFREDFSKFNISEFENLVKMIFPELVKKKVTDKK